MKDSFLAIAITFEITHQPSGKIIFHNGHFKGFLYTCPN